MIYENTPELDDRLLSLFIALEDIWSKEHLKQILSVADGETTLPDITGALTRLVAMGYIIERRDQSGREGEVCYVLADRERRGVLSSYTD